MTCCCLTFSEVRLEQNCVFEEDQAEVSFRPMHLSMRYQMTRHDSPALRPKHQALRIVGPPTPIAPPPRPPPPPPSLSLVLRDGCQSAASDRAKRWAPNGDEDPSGNAALITTLCSLCFTNENEIDTEERPGPCLHGLLDWLGCQDASC